MAKLDDLRFAIIDDIKSGAVAVMNAKLDIPQTPDFDPQNWAPEEKAKFSLICDVRDEILSRVRKTLKIDS